MLFWKESQASIEPQLLEKAGITCQLMGKRWPIHYVRVQHGSPRLTRTDKQLQIKSLTYLRTLAS
jgi:hypothetical protein